MSAPAAALDVVVRHLPGPATSPTRTVIVRGATDPDAVFVLGAAQLRINQRIGQAAIRRLNAVRTGILHGIAGDDLRRATPSSVDLGP